MLCGRVASKADGRPEERKEPLACVEVDCRDEGQLQARAALGLSGMGMRLPDWPFLYQLPQGASPSGSPQSFGLLLLILYLSNSSPEVPSPGSPAGPTGGRDPSASAQVASRMRGHARCVSPVNSHNTSWECAVRLVSASLYIGQGAY